MAAVYVLDANVLIEAYRRYYPFDIAPGFWTAPVSHAERGQITSIDKVHEELKRGADKGDPDPLVVWANEHRSVLFASTDTGAVVAQFRRVMSRVDAEARFMPAAKAEFAAAADGWLVAFAAASGSNLVTHEVPAPLARRKVKLPDVCGAVGVEFISVFDMLRRLSVRFA